MRKPDPLFPFKGVREPAGSPEPDRFTRFSFSFPPPPSDPDPVAAVHSVFLFHVLLCNK